MDRWIDGSTDGWMVEWTDILLSRLFQDFSKPSAATQAGAFCGSFSVATCQWPTSLRQEWKMELPRWWQETLWCQKQCAPRWPPSPSLPGGIQHQSDTYYSQRLSSAKASAAQVLMVLGPCLPALHCPHWWWCSKNCVCLEWKGHVFWNQTNHGLNAWLSLPKLCGLKQATLLLWVSVPHPMRKNKWGKWIGLKVMTTAND